MLLSFLSVETTSEPPRIIIMSVVRLVPQVRLSSLLEQIYKVTMQFVAVRHWRIGISGARMGWRSHLFLKGTRVFSRLFLLLMSTPVNQSTSSFKHGLCFTKTLKSGEESWLKWSMCLSSLSSQTTRCVARILLYLETSQTQFQSVSFKLIRCVISMNYNHWP